jgi:hypothetical protein
MQYISVSKFVVDMKAVETTKDSSKDSQYSGQDSNQELLEYLSRD